MYEDSIWDSLFKAKKEKEKNIICEKKNKAMDAHPWPFGFNIKIAIRKREVMNVHP